MSVSKWAYTNACEGQSCPGDCDSCSRVEVETNIYDEEELHTNCTVQILRNSVTGEVSIGWWENEEDE